MSFTLHKSDNSSVLPWEYIPGTEGSYQAGQLVNVVNGQLAPITADQTTTPPYLCMADVALPAGELLPVSRVNRDCIYETTLAAAAASAAVGAKLQVAAGGLEAKAGAGTFEIVSLDGTEAGDAARGRWV